MSTTHQLYGHSPSVNEKTRMNILVFQAVARGQGSSSLRQSWEMVMSSTIVDKLAKERCESEISLMPAISQYHR